MGLQITHTNAAPGVGLLRLEGTLDGSTYQEFVTEAEKLFDAGVRDLVVDLGGLTFMSSAGLAALHRIARVYRGEQRADLDEGWSAYRAISRDRKNGFQQHVKLLNPNETIREVLETVGFTALFEIFTDREPAIASFQ